MKFLVRWTAPTRNSSTSRMRSMARFGETTNNMRVIVSYNSTRMTEMEFQTLITAEEAYQHLDDANWAFVDCQFALTDSEQGFRSYQANHIRGAVYADLNKDLSGPIIPGITGRHPLPNEQALAQTFSRLGIDGQTQVVAYDEAGGYMAASRLWWLLHWADHTAVAVLDGGLKAWIRQGY